jgi:Poxvirus A32 protein
MLSTPGPSPVDSSQAVQRQHPFDVDHLEIKDPEYMSEVPEHLQNKDIPGFPTTVLSVGGPGSGKTNVLMNFLTREEFYCKFFDKIYLLGPTVKSDKLFKHIKVPSDQIVTESKEFIAKLSEWTDEQIHKVETNPNEAPKCLFVFEDITSYYTKVQSDPEFAKCFNAIRHHKATAWANVHKYKAFNRTARMCCMHIMVWAVNRSEQAQIYDDYGPTTLTKQDWFMLCDTIWKPDARNKKPFLYINKYAEEDKRYRRCFTDIIDLKYFDGMGVRDKKMKRLMDNEHLKTVDFKKEYADKMQNRKRKKTDVESSSGHSCGQVEEPAKKKMTKEMEDEFNRHQDVLYRQRKGPFALLH